MSEKDDLDELQKAVREARRAKLALYEIAKRWQTYKSKNHQASSKGGKAKAGTGTSKLKHDAIIMAFHKERRVAPSAKAAELYRKVAEKTGCPFNTIKGIIQADRRRRKST